MGSRPGPVFIWFFGYVGGTYYPMYQLGINQSTMVAVAKNLSSIIPSRRLVLVTSVDEIPGATINSSMLPVIESYVADLHQYAAAVYGRLDLKQFNLTAQPGTTFGDCNGGPFADYNCPIYNQTRLYLLPPKKGGLGLNGIWFDSASQYNNFTGSTFFNQMMQNLTASFPSAKFILNHSNVRYGYITEQPGYTWENNTYVCPSTFGNLAPNKTELQQFYSRFPGHVLLHMDADGPSPIGDPSRPMSIFGNQSSAQEVAVLTKLVKKGLHPGPSFVNESYFTLVPIVGSWDYINATNDGVLYNSLSVGDYARSTYSNFTMIIVDSYNL